jgi:methionyl-tRNA formyltransferase
MLNIVFMGTPEFAIPGLEILLHNNYTISAVVTAPDEPRGRGQKVLPTPIKSYALEHNLPVLQPEKLKNETFIQQLKSLNPDVIVVVAFRILPREVFAIPRLGSFNLHASLLPKYRGAAPINWAIIKGEKETGVTTFFLEEKVDTGNVILQERVPIGDDETAGELHDKLSLLGANVVLKTVQLIEQGNVSVQRQDNSLATPAPKIFKEDCRIDWTKPARHVHNFVRGLSPYPCAYTYHQGKLLKIYRTVVAEEESANPAGAAQITDNGLQISTGRGSVLIREIQQEGKKRMGTDEFLRGYQIQNGERFE